MSRVPADYESRLSAIAEAARNQAEAVAEEFRRNELLPVCKKHGFTFLSGNGTFSFYDERRGKGQPVDDDDRRIKKLVEVMNGEVLGHNDCFGFYVGDVTLTDLRSDTTTKRTTS